MDETATWWRIWNSDKHKVHRIHEIIEQVDPVIAFAVLMVRTLNLNYPGKPADTPILYERAAQVLIPRFGQGGNTDLDLILELESLLVGFNEELLHTAGEKLGFADPVSKMPNEIEALLIHGDMVRGDSFPSQTMFLIEQIQEPYAKEFHDLVGISPSVAVRILLTIYGLLEKRGGHIYRSITEHISSGIIDWVEIARFAAIPVSELQEELKDVSTDELSAFFTLFGCSSTTIDNDTSTGRLRYKPVFMLPDDTVMVIPGMSAAFDSILYAYEEVARNSDLLKETYRRSVSVWFERASAELLMRVFGNSNVYLNASYPDPYTPGGVTEIDLIVIHGPFLILGEVKSRQYRLDSRRGDHARLRTDLKRNIEEAHGQSLRAEAYLRSVDTARFTEIGSGRIVEVRCTQLHRIIHLNVTQNHFGFTQTDLSQIQSLKLFSKGSYPWSIFLMDLEIVTRFLSQPDLFFHYAKRRIELQLAKASMISDEADMLEAYLLNRLDPDTFWDRVTDDGRGFSMINFEGENIFEPFYEFGANPDLTKPEIDIPELWRDALDSLESDVPDSKLIAHYLLDLPNNLLKHLEGFIARHVANRPLGVFSISSSETHRDIRVSVLVHRGLANNRRRDLLLDIVKREKYRSRKPIGLGFSFSAKLGTVVIDDAVIVLGAWTHDMDLEAKIADQRNALTHDRQPPKRNDLCYCGSGRKYKMCCLSRDRSATRLDI